MFIQLLLSRSFTIKLIDISDHNCSDRDSDFRKLCFLSLQTLFCSHILQFCTNLCTFCSISGQKNWHIRRLEVISQSEWSLMTELCVCWINFICSFSDSDTQCQLWKRSSFWEDKEHSLTETLISKSEENLCRLFLNVFTNVW